MLFGDADVEVAVREALRELDQARAFAHGGRDADDAGVSLRHVAEPLAEHLRIGGSGGLVLEDRAAERIEGAGTVPLDRVRLGRRVALALAGDDVQELRARQVAHVAQRLHERVEVVPVDRAECS
jgi:hypothetical protein